jgi:hypothetical protein
MNPSVGKDPLLMHTARLAAGLVLLLTLAAAALSPDHLLVFVLGLELVVAIRFLWPVTDAPVLLLPFGLQWLQVAMKPIETALSGQPLDELGQFGQPLSAAAWLSAGGMAAFGFGLWLASRRRKVNWIETLSRDAARWNPTLVLQMSIGLILAGAAFAFATPRVGSAYQLLLALSRLDGVGLFVLAYWCFKTGRRLWVLAVATAVEVVLGFTGFFADFRETFFVLLVAAAAALPRLNLRSFAVVGGVFAALVVATVFWSSIKGDYRDFLNQGSHEQVVDRSLSERLSYVGEAADRFNDNQFQKGLRALADRISYIDYLAETMKYVPEVKQHENGRLIKAALTNMVMPRILFPDKPPTPNDVDITNRYTGLNIRAGAYQGTSISIGYLGELYIDYGVVGAILGSFVIGAAGGLAYRLIRSFKAIPMFLSYGFALMVLVDFTVFETDLVRFIGSAITLFAAAIVVQRLAAPQLLLALTDLESQLSSRSLHAGRALAPFR